MNDEPSTTPTPHPITIRPMVRRPVPAPTPEVPARKGRAKHFAQMDALRPKRPLGRRARKLAKLVAPIVGTGWGGNRRRKG